jgi:antitoxin MazE
VRASVRRMGNSSGVIIPKPLLSEMGAKTGDEVRLSVEGGRLVVEVVTRSPRAGWAEDARNIAAADDAALAWPEFGNDADGDLGW